MTPLVCNRQVPKGPGTVETAGRATYQLCAATAVWQLRGDANVSCCQSCRDSLDAHKPGGVARQWVYMGPDRRVRRIERPS
jgi:hypothetical protein